MNENEIAEMEAYLIDRSDNYFAARQTDDTFKHRRFFDDGFDRGYKACLDKFMLDNKEKQE